MVQISLPENSKTKKGKYFKDKTGSKNLRKVNVYRWDPSSGEGPRIDTYEVDMDNCPSKVLDILNKIKNEIDPTLAYRRSCAHGVCGSCAMNVDGMNTHNVSATISIKDDEWDDVAEWMWFNRHYYNGLSVLPYDGGTYKQAPFETITKKQYDEMYDLLGSIDLTKVIESEDNTDLSGELACAGGLCEI